MPITIAIVEDEERLREQMLLSIRDTPSLECIGAYASGEQALQEIPLRPPEVVLMDIVLPKMSGIECTFRLKRQLPAVQIVILTVYDDNELIFKALQMGATGYLLKRTPWDELVKAVEDVHSGGAPMSSYIARQVVQSFARRSPDLAPLSPREEDVLKLVAKGFVNKEIAHRLGLTVETVRSYLKNIYEKLHVSSRTAAAVKFLEARKP